MAVSVHLIGSKEPIAFRSDDIILATNTKTRAKVERIWQHSLVDVDLYLINPDNNRIINRDLHRSGLLSMTCRQSGCYSIKQANRRFRTAIIPRETAITILLTQNEGTNRIPLTGWMIAHRLFHVFQYCQQLLLMRAPKVNYEIGNLAGLCRQALYRVEDIVEHSYRVADWRPEWSKSSGFYCAVGTSKAIRSGILTSSEEIIPESFAQFMLHGHILFNPIPEQFQASLATYIGTACLMNDRGLNDVITAMTKFSTTMRTSFQQIIKLAVGKVFVL